MATTKRAYKLQEFVAHSANVNCLKIGRRTSRVLVTGGEDHKVNLWALGKPNALLSLSSHTSAVESVSFDSSEVLVAAGAASGTIKLWDLEEAKIVRTSTGHRSNCISIDFHPFGEFFASGSLDTNLKIWDIRRKGCIHTYKGHTRGVNCIRFTPDGRWVVSGGEDNVVKIWDLTAGKLLHDFKYHEGQIQCIDFHPHEFLLATGSADKTVKFWDLETFELIGSAGPETTGVRAMTFNPDGRTLLCGLQESLKVFSWEPIRCHDAVDVGWSKLSDLNIHEGKLIGCSYNQSCVGVWVVDISRIEPYAVGNVARPNGQSQPKSNSSSSSLQIDTSIKATMGRLSVSEEALTKEAKPVASTTRTSVLQSSEPLIKETRLGSSSASVPGTPQRFGLTNGLRVSSASSAIPQGAASLKKSISKSHGVASQTFSKSEVIPVIVPRTNSRPEVVSDSRKEVGSGRSVPYIQPRVTEMRKLSNTRDNSDDNDVSIHSGSFGSKGMELNDAKYQNIISSPSSVNQQFTIGERHFPEIRGASMGKVRVPRSTEPTPGLLQDNCDVGVSKARESFSNEPTRGRTRSIVANLERQERSASNEGPTSSSSDTISTANISYASRVRVRSIEKATISANDDEAIADLMEQHNQFLISTQSRLTKLQVIQRQWERKDIRGVISAMERMSDSPVSADIVSILMEKSDIITLDLCTILMPVLTKILESKMDRHLTVSLEMLLKILKTFGPVIHSTLLAGPSVGVDLQAEERLEKCNQCFIELQKITKALPLLTRRGGSIAKLAQEVNLALHEVS